MSIVDGSVVCGCVSGQGVSIVDGSVVCGHVSGQEGVLRLCPNLS